MFFNKAIRLRLPHSCGRRLHDLLLALKAAGYSVLRTLASEDLGHATQELAVVSSEKPGFDVSARVHEHPLQICGRSDESAISLILDGSFLRFPIARQFLALGCRFEDKVLPKVAMSIYRIDFSDELIDVMSRYCYTFGSDNSRLARREYLDRIFDRHPHLILKSDSNFVLRGSFGGSDEFGWYASVSFSVHLWEFWKQPHVHSDLTSEMLEIGGQVVRII